MNRVIVLLVFIVALLSLSCSEDKPSAPDYLQSGVITFQNSLQYQSIYITYIIQQRGATRESRMVNYLVPAHGRRSIENFLDGGYDFPGGDDVSITFESAARHPAEPENPYFERTVVLTVNGTQNIRVKGEEGEYDIRGDE